MQRTMLAWVSLRNRPEEAAMEAQTLTSTDDGIVLIVPEDLMIEVSEEEILADLLYPAKRP
jgi:hypothetical protein